MLIEKKESYLASSCSSHFSLGVFQQSLEYLCQVRACQFGTDYLLQFHESKGNNTIISINYSLGLRIRYANLYGSRRVN